MKRKSILSKQSVKRRHPADFSGIFSAFRTVSSFSLKAACLLFGVISISLLFLYLYQYLVSTPYIKLKEVSIEGVDDSLRKELVELAGLGSDLSLLTLDLNGMKKKMESHPWVRAVELEKSFPSLLRIKVEREEPFAIVVLDRLYYMNRMGRAFKEVKYFENKDYPVITGITEEKYSRDDYLKVAAGILAVFENDKGAWSIDKLSELHFNDIDRVSLYSTVLPVVLRMGCMELAEKKKDLVEIIDHLKSSGQIHMVKAIDMNYEDGALISLREAG